MARINLHNLPPQEQKELLKRFFTAITSLGNLKEVENFFKDLLHPQETVMLARRLKAAEMLINGGTFDEISRQMKISPTTIAKIHRWVNSGRDGYKTATKHLKKLDKRQERKNVKEFKALEHDGWERFKKIYPTFDMENIDEIIDAIEDYARKKKRKKSLKKD